MRSGLAASRGLRSCVPPRVLLGVAPRSRWPAGIAASSRGVAKPLALAGIALAALAGFFHYTRIGPNEVSAEDEAAAEEEARRIKGEPEERDDARS